MAFELPKLPYKYTALEPFIDRKTMKIHHDNHHQGYVDKLNQAIIGHDNLKAKDIKDLIKNLENVPKDIREIVRNQGGGHLNHSFFWELLKKNSSAENTDILKKINEDFGNVEKFKEEFKNAAIALFGSGWTWLVLEGSKLKIVNTSNHDNPITYNMFPLLVIDMWEHAYYLKYQNKKDAYLDAFFNIINWEKVDENYVKSLGE
jgi:Fe-Mn family superoxide dismutase